MEGEHLAERLADQADQLGRPRADDHAIDGHAVQLGQPLGQPRASRLGVSLDLHRVPGAPPRRPPAAAPSGFRLAEKSRRGRLAQPEPAADAGRIAAVGDRVLT